MSLMQNKTKKIISKNGRDGKIFAQIQISSPKKLKGSIKHFDLNEFSNYVSVDVGFCEIVR